MLNAITKPEFRFWAYNVSCSTATLIGVIKGLDKELMSALFLTFGAFFGMAAYNTPTKPLADPKDIPNTLRKEN